MLHKGSKDSEACCQSKRTTTKLKELSQQSSWEIACSLLSTLQQQRILPQAVDFAITVAACARAVAWQKALTFLQDMSDLHMAPSIVAHNSGINACARARRWQQCLANFAALRSGSVEPSAITLNSLVAACEKAAKWQQALLLLFWARDASLCDTVTFNSALSACEKGSQWEHAMNLLQEMDASRIAQDAISGSAALCTLERNSKWKEVLDLHDQMEPASASQAPSVSLAIQAWGHRLQWQAAASLLSATRKESLQSDTQLVGCAVSLFAKAAAWSSAFSHLQGAAAGNSRIDHIALTAATSAHASAGQWQVPMNMLGQAMWRDDTSVSFGLSAMEKANSWSLANEVLQGSAAQQVRLSLVTYNVAVAAGRRAAWHRAHGMLIQLQQQFLKSDVVGFSTCIAACNEFGSWIAASLMLERMNHLQVQLNTVTAGAATSSFEASQRWEEALEFVRMATGANLLLNGVQLGTVASSVREARGLGHARKFLDHARRLWVEAEPPRPRPFAKQSSYQIIANTPGIFAVSKPHGCATEELVARLQQQMNCELSIASRLDYGTSGVLPIAFGSETSAGTRWLQAQFAARVVHKQYLCLCLGDRDLSTSGRLRNSIRTCNVGLQKWTSEVLQLQDGNAAITDYTLLARYEDPISTNKFCLLLITPLTGRTHQIRVHMASIDLPIVGDTEYGPGSLGMPWCSRLFLHCSTLDLMGLDGETLHFSAELPHELQLMLMQLQVLESKAAWQDARKMTRRQSSSSLHKTF